MLDSARFTTTATQSSIATVSFPYPITVGEFDPPLDKGIENAVLILRQAGIETYESCEGGSGHCYPEPTIRFHGEQSDGFRALAVALQHALPVKQLNRTWQIINGEPTGPTWEMVFWKQSG